jgi:hypothetical protein
MIIPLAYFQYNKFDKKKENFDNNDDDSSVPLIIFIISYIISFYAAYLSLNCNTEIQFTSYIWAFIAFLLGLLYLVYYFFVNYLTNTCSTLRNAKSN